MLASELQLAAAGEKEKAKNKLFNRDKLINSRSERYQVLIGSPEGCFILIHSDWLAQRSRDRWPTNQQRDKDELFNEPISSEQDNKKPLCQPINIE